MRASEFITEILNDPPNTTTNKTWVIVLNTIHKNDLITGLTDAMTTQDGLTILKMVLKNQEVQLQPKISIKREEILFLILLNQIILTVVLLFRIRI